MIDDALKERTAVNRQSVIDLFRSIEENSLLKEKRRKKRNLHFAEIIQDVGLFRFVGNSDFELSLPQRKRSLLPTVTRRLPCRTQTKRCSLLFTIVAGKNFPIKVERVARNSNTAGQQEIGSNEVERLSPAAMVVFAPNFNYGEEEHLGIKLKIKFRGKTYTTKVVSASMSPFWNETLVIPLDDVIQESSSCPSIFLEKELVDIFIFDCVDIDVRHKGGFYDDEETKISEHRYLVRTSILFMSPNGCYCTHLANDSTFDPFNRGASLFHYAPY